MSIFDKFKLGLSKSSKSLSSGLNDLIFKKKIDENTLNELEDFLIQSDVGVESAKELKNKFSNTKVDAKNSDKNGVYKIFSNYISEILKPLEKNLESIKSNKPSVILVAGVNGVGKTTTIGKLGKISWKK
jgi:Signal recognition particle GTPase